MARLDEIPAEDFEALVGQRLPLSAPDATVQCLVEQVWRSPYPTGRSLPGFSVFLRGPLERPLAQGCYGIGHPVHGDLELFLTPVGKDAEGMRYEIVFN